MPTTASQHQDSLSHTNTTMTSAGGPVSTAADGTNEDYFASYEDVEVTDSGALPGSQRRRKRIV